MLDVTKTIKLTTELCFISTHDDRILAYDGTTPFTDSFYDDLLKAPQQNVQNVTAENIHHAESAAWSSLTRGILVIFLRIGFILIQVGSVPVNNVNLILLQNVVDICTVTTSYLLVGQIVAYTGDYGGFVAEGYWIGHPSVDKNEAVVGWQTVIVASAICTGGIVGRTHTVGYVLVAMILSAGVEPLLIHWAWTSKGWLAENNLAGNKVHFRDYGGSALVHVVGALSGLIGCLTLGRRILRLKEIDEASIGNDSSGVTFAGYLLVFVGLLGLCLPNLEHDYSKTMGKQLPHIIINGLLAASTCSLVVVLMHFVLSGEIFNHWTVMRCIQGTVSGLVTISAGINVYSHPVAAGLGCFAGGVFFLVSRMIFRSALEDYCNIVAGHFVCGFLGCLLVPLSDLEMKLNVRAVLLNVAWQFIGFASIFGLVIIILAPTFLVLDCCGLLRNRWEFLNHERARRILENNPARLPLSRIFPSDVDTLYLQPGSTTGTGRRSSVGPRFTRYEQELAHPETNNEEPEQGNAHTVPEPENEEI